MTQRTRSRRARTGALAKSARAGSHRCAIYTRVSNDQGLEQDFNSLDAQREACAAYIRSQTHENWTLFQGHFDDGGYSGGNMERPALQALLEVVKQRQIDVIVVYKVDRLTRSLADFAKLVEILDAHGVSFVSITQSFNTTTSMGRLTLNMLLSFAQFEREVTSERIRDKIAASKKKGIWVGGTVPMGYRVKDRKLIVDEEEAKTVRLIFERYLALGSIRALVDDLRDRGVVTRRRDFATGKTVGGIPFRTGPVAYLLKNRMYLGEINHGMDSYPGDHPSIVPKDLFDAVQASVAEKAAAVGSRRSKSNAPLTGKLFDHLGRPMTPSYAVKGSVRYRYYLSESSHRGRPTSRESVMRVPAAEVEQAVVDALAGQLPSQKPGPGHEGKLGGTRCPKAPGQPTEIDVDLIGRLVQTATIKSDGIEIALAVDAARQLGVATILAPSTKSPMRVQRQVLAPAEGEWDDPRVMSWDTRGRLLWSIAKSRRWLNDLVHGRMTDLAELTGREERSSRSVAQLLSLAFIAPDLVKAIAQNRMPRGIGLTEMMELPAEWRAQWCALGIAATGRIP